MRALPRRLNLIPNWNKSRSPKTHEHHLEKTPDQNQKGKKKRKLNLIRKRSGYSSVRRSEKEIF